MVVVRDSSSSSPPPPYPPMKPPTKPPPSLLYRKRKQRRDARLVELLPPVMGWAEGAPAESRVGSKASSGELHRDQGNQQEVPTASAAGNQAEEARQELGRSRQSSSGWSFCPPTSAGFLAPGTPLSTNTISSSRGLEACEGDGCVEGTKGVTVLGSFAPSAGMPGNAAMSNSSSSLLISAPQVFDSLLLRVRAPIPALEVVLNEGEDWEKGPESIVRDGTNFRASFIAPKAPPSQAEADAERMGRLRSRTLNPEEFVASGAEGRAHGGPDQLAGRVRHHGSAPICSGGVADQLVGIWFFIRLGKKSEDEGKIVSGLHCKMWVQFENYSDFCNAMNIMCGRSMQKQGSRLKVDYEVTWDREGFFQNVQQKRARSPVQDKGRQMQAQGGHRIHEVEQY